MSKIDHERWLLKLIDSERRERRAQERRERENQRNTSLLSEHKQSQRKRTRRSPHSKSSDVRTLLPQTVSNKNNRHRELDVCEEFQLLFQEIVRLADLKAAADKDEKRARKQKRTDRFGAVIRTRYQGLRSGDRAERLASSFGKRFVLIEFSRGLYSHANSLRELDHSVRLKDTQILERAIRKLDRQKYIRKEWNDIRKRLIDTTE